MTLRSAAAELRAENERVAAEINELMMRNTRLQRELMSLNTNRDVVVSQSTNRVQVLTDEVTWFLVVCVVHVKLIIVCRFVWWQLQSLDDELRSVQSQCATMKRTIADQQAQADAEAAAAMGSRRRGMSAAAVPASRPRRGTIMNRITRASTMVKSMSVDSIEFPGSPMSGRGVKAPLSRANSERPRSAEKSPFFRRGGGPLRRNIDTVVL